MLVTKSTDLTKLNKQFDINTSETAVSKSVGSDICNLKAREAYQQVNVKAKAVRMSRRRIRGPRWEEYTKQMYVLLLVLSG